MGDDIHVKQDDLILSYLNPLYWLRILWVWAGTQQVIAFLGCEIVSRSEWVDAFVC